MRALITGANRGVGLAMAEALAARGDHVIATTRSAMPLANVQWEQADMADPASISALAERVEGPLDLLICNAGVLHDREEALETGYPPEMWAETFAVNVTGVFLMIQALLPQLRAAGAAKIAILSSQLGSNTRATGGRYIYRASKSAALNLGRNLAHDLAPEGIAVGIYHPGWVQTDMGGSAADITATQAATGLIQRFDALGPDTTGVFETWDGQPHPL
ncbi:SDR family NAD(P)-dependent oxidoreductase [Roseobacter sp. HKCCD9010]|uniref:SDR family oxidoreductase n=1 Tax=unclassified Roseobacter TaxID=196798 RepID=UPI001490DA8C|nr:MULTISPECIES: SDR family oxidoreductase [unclassified Roseobacter]MBF9049246.1 SDR family NAD(P)-dependent oxidoreductase [Rhodobacterales bacterium HKCCD4356]NNV11246.1 SDR family NAD(P)-dependent oxidoreductase [Roseobacter sp. HKCCD7357]NNV15430.1 SDR family NAD(P)-dependent oxidoreductase [Roseobacter sp. HKCCD8768]NNV24890.1 SDR family NAD(P)-dependent oxidoreductase [Roseobacter sp. HKCCD8192]NNV29147.1 SDR family NAD(P)-dependent oxidoreductase [Roseobacter sp. HKCCD9061]